VLRQKEEKEEEQEETSQRIFHQVLKQQKDQTT
jgi:hypothetical protein